jgi:signal transduction histidine kinase
VVSGGVSGLRLPVGRAGDAALAGLVFAVAFLGGIWWIFAEHAEPWPATAVSWALIAVASGALYLRRRHPVAVAAVVLAATVAYYVVTVHDGPLIIALVVALYTVAAQGRLRAAAVVAAASLLAVGGGTLAGNRDVNAVALVMFSGWLVATVALGWARHSRRLHAEQVQHRAATEERLRIAREVHDVVGHHISLMNVQASAALHRIRKDPAQAQAALGAIKESSRQALRDLRSTLGMLRAADDAAPVAPAAGLDRIGELIESAEAAGLTVQVRTSGEPGPLPTEIDLAAYRIVQESLTNVARHSDATAVTVHIDRAPGEVRVEVTDNGRGTKSGGRAPGRVAKVGGEPALRAAKAGAEPTPRAAASASVGSGISGMRERARALGGDLTAGPRPGGGFVVSARLPYRTAA